MATPEGRVKKRVTELLKKYGAYYFMPVQCGFGSVGLDYHCVIKGKGFMIETKAGNKQPTPRQEETIKQIQRAGGKCFVVNEVEGMDTLETWLKETNNGMD